MILGYVAATITSLFFTAYVVPKKLCKLPAESYSMFQGMGYFLGSLLGFIFSRFTGFQEGDTFANPMLWLAAVNGLTWFLGSVFFLKAIDALGLSRSNQWKNLQGPFGAIFNLLFLAEYGQTNVALVLLASACILVSAFLFNIKNESSQTAVSNADAAKSPNKRLKTEKANNRGIIWALISAVLFGLTSMFQKKVTSTGAYFSQLVVISGTVFLSALVYLIIKGRVESCGKSKVASEVIRLTTSNIAGMCPSDVSQFTTAEAGKTPSLENAQIFKMEAGKKMATGQEQMLTSDADTVPSGISCLKLTFKKDGLLGILGGALYFCAAFFSTMAYSVIPGSIAFTIIQLNAVWTVLVGIIIFKEINFKTNWVRVCCGILAALAGIVLLLFA